MDDRARGRNGYLESRRGVRGEWSDRIDGLFETFDKPGRPGLNLAVFKGDAVVHARGYGVARIEDDVPFTPDTVLRLGSTSKHLCAACIYLLVKEGRLSVEDDVRSYVPELRGIAADIAVDHLLTMTSGLMEWLNLPLFVGLRQGSPIRRADMLDWLGRQTATMFPPGATSSYSNTNYALLSLIVERLAGQPLAEFMQQRLFAPLDMHDTRLVTHSSQVVPNMATGYDPGPDGAFVQGFMLPEIHGEGGVNTTLADMTRWYRAYREDRIARGLRAWLEEGCPLADGSFSPYRRGIVVDRQSGVARVGHAGGMPGYLSEFAVYPDLDAGVVMLTNVMDTSSFARVDTIAELVAGRTFAAKADAEPPPSGLFVCERTGHAVAVEPDGATCHCLGETVPLRPDGPRRWRFAKRGDVRALSLTADGKLCLHDGAMPPVELTPCAAPLAVPEPERYVGAYRCAALGERHVVSWSGNELVVSTGAVTRPLLWSRLVRRAGELFTAPIESEPSETNVTLRFHAGEGGALIGFDYAISRIYGLRFDRVSDDPR